MPGNTRVNDFTRAQLPGASMRPQRNAGEYEAVRRLNESTSLASMRPQRNAGEYVAAAKIAANPQEASMRPQRNAGEYAIAKSLKPPNKPLQ